MSLRDLLKDSAYSALAQVARRNLVTDRAILMYHSVGADHPLGPLDISLDAFERQLDWLSQEYDIVGMGEILDPSRRGRIVAITFDDGYSQLYPHVTDLLIRYGAPAAFYIPSGLVGKTISTSYGDSTVMDWDALEELVSMGFDIGSHALTHSRLTSLDTGVLRTEIFESRMVLEDRLKVTVEDFAYPGGKYDERALQAVEDAGYKRAVTVAEVPLNIEGNRFTLPRVGIFATTTMAQFKAKLSGAGYYYNRTKVKLLS